MEALGQEYAVLATALGFIPSCFFSRNVPGLSIADLMPCGLAIVKTIYLMFKNVLNIHIVNFENDTVWSMFVAWTYTDDFFNVDVTEYYTQKK